MAMSRWLAPGVVSLGVAFAACDSPDRRDDQETVSTTQSALTTSLFLPYVAYPTGSSPEAVAIGDLDGDSRNDVALLTSGVSDPANDKMVHVFLQNADGSLKPRVKYAVGGRSSSIDIGDVNGDGRADVVVGIDELTNDRIGVLLQSATGTLDAVVFYPTANANQVKLGDFDGDGRMDVASLSWGSNGTGLDVFLQNDTGTLTAPVTYSVTHAGSSELDAGDVNGDGRTDVVVISGQPDMSVLLQNSDGTLEAPTSYSLSASNVSPSGVAIGDTNGDGRDDVVLSCGGNRPTSFIARFIQNSQGGLDPEVSYPSLDIPSALVLADVDGDGRKDALVAHSGFSQLGVYRQFPNGDILTEELYAIPSASGNEPQGLAIGDINGDGRPDAVIADYNRGLIVLRHVAETALGLAVTAPTDGATYYTGVPLTVRWTTGDTIQLASFDVSVGYSAGFGVYTYTPLAGCAGLPPTATECVWTPTSASGFPVRVRVTARNAQGQTTFRETSFTLVTPSIGPMAPSLPLLIGTTTKITWLHNLPPNDTVRVELTRDGGASYETLATAVPISVPTNTTAGTFNWTATGPATTTARWRVTPNAFPPLLGTSSQNFAITTTPTLSIYSPGAGASYYTNSVSCSWTSNAGNVGTVSVELSRDGGATFETIVASAPNTGGFSGSVPGPSADDARFRVTLSISGSEPVTAVSSSFKLFHPEVAITSPAAGSTLFPGTPVAITWSSNLPANWSARVELSRNGGSTYEILTESVPNTGSFNWVVTGAATSAARARVTLRGGGLGTATSGTFAIAAPSVTVTGPAAGAAVYAGTPLAITWSTNLPASSPVTVELSRDGGSTYEVLVTGAVNTGSFGWIATGASTAAAVARVTITGPGTTSATSGPFGIVEPSLIITGPAPGAAVYAGTPVAITWSTNLPATAPVLVELSRDGGLTFETLAAAAPNTGRFDWAAAGPDSDAVLARVTMTDPVALTSTSGAFAIATAALTVTGPSAGTLAWGGTPVTITWTHNLPAGDPVSIELSRDGGASFEVLAAVTANTGSFVWTASGPDTAQARVRVASLGAVSTSGVGAAFQIVNPTLAVTSPTAGASWAIGTARTISWTSNLAPGTTVSVALSRDGGATWTSLAPAAPASGSLAWTASGPATSAAIVRVTANGSVPAVATSGAFAIGNPALSVTSPVAGASWTIGTPQAISWTSNLLPSAMVKVQISRNGGSTFTTLASSAPNTGTYAWTATGGASTTAIVKVSANGFTATALSGTFSLVAARVTVTSPNTAVTWTIGTTHAVTWTHNVGAGAQFTIEVSRAGVWSVIDSAATAGATSGSYDWTVVGPKATNAKVRVTWNGGTAKDTSDVAFKIN
jgi:hypothetical protein